MSIRKEYIALTLALTGGLALAFILYKLKHKKTLPPSDFVSSKETKRPRCSASFSQEDSKVQIHEVRLKECSTCGIAEHQFCETESSDIQSVEGSISHFNDSTDANCCHLFEQCENLDVSSNRLKSISDLYNKDICLYSEAPLFSEALASSEVKSEVICDNFNTGSICDQLHQLTSDFSKKSTSELAYYLNVNTKSPVLDCTVSESVSVTSSYKSISSEFVPVDIQLCESIKSGNMVIPDNHCASVRASEDSLTPAKEISGGGSISCSGASEILHGSSADKSAPCSSIQLASADSTMPYDITEFNDSSDPALVQNFAKLTTGVTPLISTYDSRVEPSTKSLADSISHDVIQSTEFPSINKDKKYSSVLSSMKPSSSAEDSADLVDVNKKCRDTLCEPDEENIPSDVQSLISQASVDSGQGSIEIDPELSYLVSNKLEPCIVYDFEISQNYIGRLIGRKGSFVNKIRAETSAYIFVEPVVTKRAKKICRIEGTQSQVDAALKLIRKNFPKHHYPDLSLTNVSKQSVLPAQQPEVDPQTLLVEIPAGVVVEVQVSAIASPGEIWVQQPLHPAYSSFDRLHQCIKDNYGDGGSAPLLPSPVPSSIVCVGRVGTDWYRCQVQSSSSDSCVALLLDIGGYRELPQSALRQIRFDYMSLPFQATHCFLSGIQPCSDDGWTEEGSRALQSFVSGCIVFATVVAYTQDGIPCINLYLKQQDQYLYLNEKMVELGHARWMDLSPVS